MSLSHRSRLLFAGAGVAVLLLVVLFLRPRRERAVARGFYYWKTAYRLGPYERGQLGRLACRSLYLRCFDVDLGPDGRPQPVGVVSLPQAADSAFDLVPVVYLTQPVLQQVSDAGLPQLAAGINSLLSSLAAGTALQRSTEVQIDCDWTAGMRERYFSLLRQLRGQPFFQGRKLSCTIRLHQVKYMLRNGIPPVDRGLLMCYNLGDLRRPGDHNSILEAAAAKEYLESIGSYPLPLDVALPIFEWAVQFRQNAFRGILRGLSPESIAGSGLFRSNGGSLYRARYDSVWMGYQFAAGDIIRVERPDPKEVLDVAAYIADRRKDTAMRVLLFHADSLLLSKHPVHELEALYDAFL